jgi:hypothetical protein
MRQTFKQFIAESEKIQKLAKLLNVTGKELDDLGEDSVLTILKNIGEHDFSPDSEFDAEQLKMGIEIEKEHTKSNLIAKLITKDHLKEDPKYYSKLKKMENE